MLTAGEEHMEPGRKEAIGRTYSLLGMLCLLPDALVIRLTQVQVQSENASAYATNMLLGFGLLFWRSLGQLVSISVLHFTLFSHCSATTCVHTVRSTLPMPSLFPGGMFQMLAQAFFITSIANTTVANTLLCIGSFQLVSLLVICTQTHSHMHMYRRCIYSRSVSLPYSFVVYFSHVACAQCRVLPACVP